MTPIIELDLKNRAANCASLLGIEFAEDLANREDDPRQWRNAGDLTVLHMARALLRLLITPVWLRKIAPDIDYSAATTARDKVLPGWQEMAGPYATADYWMLERAIADMERGGIPWTLVPWDGGTPALTLWRRGGVAVAPEAEDAP